VDEGSKERPYPHAIVAGVERYPRRSKVKPFIKVS
jgi:large subunit ribosomal protein L27e